MASSTSCSFSIFLSPSPLGRKRSSKELSILVPRVWQVFLSVSSPHKISIMGALNAMILLSLTLMPALAATASLGPVPTLLARTARPLPRQTSPVVPDAPTEFLDACSRCSIRRCLGMWEWVPDIQPDPAYLVDSDDESLSGASNGKSSKRNKSRWRSPFGGRMARPARPAVSSLPPATTSPPLFQVPSPPQTTALPEVDGSIEPYTETFIAYSVVTVSATVTSVELNANPPEWFTPPPTNEATTHVEMAYYTDGADTISVEL